MTIFCTIIFGFSTSLLATIIFTFIFTQIKPRLKISSEICHNDGTYKIKVINKNCWSVINVKTELSYINFFNVPNGVETNSLIIQLTKNELFSIDKYDKKSEYKTFSFRFVTHENLINGLKENNRQFLRFKISATHSLSNIGKVFTKEYSLKEIKEGDFKFGDSFEIVDI